METAELILNVDSRISGECERFVGALCDEMGQAFVGAALFGSWARGDANENSDIDMLVIACGLPDKLWARQLRLREPLSRRELRIPSLMALTPDEFLARFPSFYLDIGQDARIVHDATGWLAERLDRIRQITREAGLIRTGERGHFCWNWDRPPPGNWELTWEGFRELP